MGRGNGLDRLGSHASRFLGLSMHTGDLALTWWLLMIAPGLIGAILGFSFTGNARGLVAGAVLGPLAMITLLIFSGSAHAQLRFDDEQQRIYMNLDDCMLNSLQ